MGTPDLGHGQRFESIFLPAPGIRPGTYECQIYFPKADEFIDFTVCLENIDEKETSTLKLLQCGIRVSQLKTAPSKGTRSLALSGPGFFTAALCRLEMIHQTK